MFLCVCIVFVYWLFKVLRLFVCCGCVCCLFVLDSCFVSLVCFFFAYFLLGGGCLSILGVVMRVFSLCVCSFCELVF